MNRVLYIGAHTDDIELACGGTIAKSHDEIHCLIFSVCDNPLLHTEFRNTFLSLGIKEQNTRVLNYNFREFYWQQSHILNILLEMRRAILPIKVFSHSINCVHQDHKIVAQESLRAFKNDNLFTYTHPWNGNGDENHFVELSEEHLNSKIKALANYKSQEHRSYFNPEFIRAQAVYNGIKCGKKYAEAFRIEKLIA